MSDFNVIMPVDEWLELKNSIETAVEDLIEFANSNPLYYGSSAVTQAEILLSDLRSKVLTLRAREVDNASKQSH